MRREVGVKREGSFAADQSMRTSESPCEAENSSEIAALGNDATVWNSWCVGRCKVCL